MRTTNLIATVLAVVSFAFASTGMTANGNLAFTPPTTRTDGSVLPASEIASYNLSCTYTPTGGTAVACNHSPTSLPGNATGGIATFTVTQDGQACFRLQTVDTAGRTSALTSPACKAIVIPPPNPPTNVTVSQAVGVEVSVGFTILSSGARSSTVSGFVPNGTPCVGARVFSYRSQDYYETDRAAIAWMKGVNRTSRVAFPCAATIYT